MLLRSILYGLLLAAFSLGTSHADEEFSKEYKVQQLRNSAKLLKVGAVTEAGLGALFVYGGLVVSRVSTGGGVIYLGLGALNLGGAYWLWNMADANEKEADRMERDLKGLLHLESGELAVKLPQLKLSVEQKRKGLAEKPTEIRVALVTYSF